MFELMLNCVLTIEPTLTVTVRLRWIFNDDKGDDDHEFYGMTDDNR